MRGFDADVYTLTLTLSQGRGDKITDDGALSVLFQSDTDHVIRSRGFFFTAGSLFDANVQRLTIR